MESFACLIQTYTGQDKEGEERAGDGKWEREKRRGLWRNRQKEVVGRETQSTRKRDYWDRKTGSRERERERAGGKKLLRPTTHHPTSVFIKRIVSISPGVEAFISPRRCPMSRGPGIFWCRRLWGSAGLGKALLLTERQLSDYSPAERSHYRWNDLCSITTAIPFPLQPSLHDSRRHQSWQSPRFTFICRWNAATGHMFDRTWMMDKQSQTDYVAFEVTYLTVDLFPYDSLNVNCIWGGREPALQFLLLLISIFFGVVNAIWDIPNISLWQLRSSWNKADISHLANVIFITHHESQIY